MRKHKFLAALAMLAVASPTVALAQDASVETEVVDAMNKLFGSHAGFRSNHAKGLVVEGAFKAAPEAAALSKAILFDGSEIPVTVRFSDATGIPDIPDGSLLAIPHGMAIKYHLPDGSETDMVLNSLKFFPVATGEEFRDLLLALVESPPDAAAPTKFDSFVSSHPTVLPAFASAATPASFAEQAYYGINAFVFVNAAGDQRLVRYQMLPERALHLTTGDAAAQAPDFLFAELPERLRRGPVAFHLKAQLAEPGDPTTDATQPWPDERQLVELGVLTIDRIAADSAEEEKALLFLPGLVTDGIEPSDDPLLAVRDGAYAESFSRRSE